MGVWKERRHQGKPLSLSLFWLVRQRQQMKALLHQFGLRAHIMALWLHDRARCMPM